jgi:eukaryotic-like serine/threonine-protein kinase
MTSSSTPPSTPDGPSAVINGRYEIRALLGNTSWSNDFRARDLLLDRDVVFKALRPELISDRGFIERFRAQAQAAANLTHPALASVFDWGRDPNGFGDRPGPTYYLIAEDVGGRSIRQLVDANGPMPIDRALHVLIGVTSALSYANRAEVIHGGVSPENVAVTTTGVVKVADVGLGLALGSLWQPAEDQPAYALWRSPEVTRGETADGRTDVYNVGLLAYFLLTGRPPFPGETASQIAERHRSVIPPAPSKVNSRIPKALESIIGKSLAKNPGDRFASPSELRNALVRFRETRVAPPADQAPTSSTNGQGAPEAAAAVGIGAASNMTETTGSARSGPVPVDSRGDYTRADVTTFSGPDPDATRVSPTRPDEDRTQMLKRSTGAVNEDVADRSLGAPTGSFAELDKLPKRSSKALVAVLVVLLAALGGLSYLVIQQLKGPVTSTIVVPNVVGRPSADAETAIAAAGLNVEVQEVPSDTVAQDFVIVQSPLAGAKLPKDAKVIIQVSTGVAKPIVPQVKGETIDGARAKLLRAGFQVEIAEKEDDTAEPGTVISQDPLPDTESTPGAVVRITVATSSGTVEIPDVTQLAPEDARLALTKALFRITVQTEASQTVDQGKVIRTEPAGGEKVDRGSAVVIVVSGGNATLVPDLRGKTQADAETTLNSLGLKIDVTTRAVVNADEIGTVITQTPSAGKEIDPGGTVSVRIGIQDTTSATKKPTTTVAEVVPVETEPPASGSAQVQPTTEPAPTAPPTPAPTTPPTPAPTTPPATEAPPIAVVPAVSPEPTVAPPA